MEFQANNSEKIVAYWYPPKRMEPTCETQTEYIESGPEYPAEKTDMPAITETDLTPDSCPSSAESGQCPAQDDNCESREPDNQPVKQETAAPESGLPSQLKELIHLIREQNKMLEEILEKYPQQNKPSRKNNSLIRKLAAVIKRTKSLLKNF